MFHSSADIFNGSVPHKSFENDFICLRNLVSNLRYRRVGRRHPEDPSLPSSSSQTDFDATDAIVDGGIPAGAAGQTGEVAAAAAVERVFVAASSATVVVTSDSL